jgi:regulatory protein
MKRIPPAVISDAFAQFSESQLNESLQTLLEKKRRSITGRSDYERNGKLIRYALGRGFPMEEIIRCLEKMDIESYPDDPQ